jgi:hypothetical protein
LQKDDLDFVDEVDTALRNKSGGCLRLWLAVDGSLCLLERMLRIDGVRRAEPGWIDVTTLNRRCLCAFPPDLTCRERDVTVLVDWKGNGTSVDIDWTLEVEVELGALEEPPGGRWKVVRESWGCERGRRSVFGNQGVMSDEGVWTRDGDSEG